MKGEMMRAPLIKSGVVLLVFVLLAYFTSTSAEGSVLNSIGMIVLSAFRLVQWSLAMIIGLAFSIAFLFAIFLGAVAMVDKYAAAGMYRGLKQSLASMLAPVLSMIGSVRAKEQTTVPPAPMQATPPVVETTDLKEELQAVIADEIKKVAADQQGLGDQVAALAGKISQIEENSAGFAVTGQVESIAGSIADTGKMLGTVQETLSALEAKVNAVAQQVQALTPDKMLGDIPARLEKIEQADDPGFDPQPLTESIASLQKEIEALKKKGQRTKKKA